MGGRVGEEREENDGTDGVGKRGGREGGEVGYSLLMPPPTNPGSVTVSTIPTDHSNS